MKTSVKNNKYIKRFSKIRRERKGMKEQTLMWANHTFFTFQFTFPTLKII